MIGHETDSYGKAVKKKRTRKIREIKVKG
jgi:hypothetical protein